MGRGCLGAMRFLEYTEKMWSFCFYSIFLSSFIFHHIPAVDVFVPKCKFKVSLFGGKALSESS